MPRTYGTTNAAPYAAAPVVGPVGDTYYNTATKQLNLSDGTQWNPITGGGGGGPYSFAWVQTLTAPTVVSSPYTVTHNLNTTTPLVQVWDASTGLMVQTQVTVVNANTIQISVAQNMPNNANVVVLGSANSPIPIAPGDYATKAYVDARTPNLPAPVTSGSGIQSFTDALGDVWIAANGVAGGAWKRARDVLHSRWYRASAFSLVVGIAILPMDTLVNDPYGLYATATAAFTAPVNGVYQCGLTIAAQPTAAGAYISALLYTGGNPLAVVNNYASAVGQTWVPIATTSVYLAAGASIVTEGRSSAGSAAGVAGYGNTYASFDYLGTG